MANNERTEKKHAFLYTKLDFNILINHPSCYHNHFANRKTFDLKQTNASAKQMLYTHFKFKNKLIELTSQLTLTHAE